MAGANSILAKMTVVIAGQSAQLLSELNKSNKALDRFEQSATRIGKTLTAAFVAEKAYEGLQYGIGVMKDFERQMDTVAAISGATGEDLKKLESNAVNLAGAFKSIDIARMETELSRLGFRTSEIIDSTKAIIDLATATGEDLAKSSEIVGSTLRIFQLEAKESGRVAETMAIGFNTSALALDNFGEAMKYVGPVANAANLSLEQTTALLGVLADSGVKGSMAGTSLRKIISDLGQGAAPILNQRLREMAAAGLSAADAQSEVGRTAYTSLLILANNTSKIDEAVKAQTELKGTLEATSKVMQDNLQGDLDKLNAAWDRMFISTSGIIPVFRKLTQEATDFVNLISGNGGASPLEKAVYEFERFSSNFNSSFSERTQQDVKTLEKLASAAGIKVGYIWDETGSKIRKAFRIENSGSNGPNPFQPFVAGLTSLKSISGPTAKSVSDIKAEIEALNKSIEGATTTAQVLDYKSQIAQLEVQLGILLGTMQKVDVQMKKARDEYDAWIQRIEDAHKTHEVNQNRTPLNNIGGDPFSGFRPGSMDSMKRMYDAQIELAKKASEAQERENRKTLDRLEKLGMAYTRYGDIAADVIASSITGGEDLTKALARQTDRIVTELYRQAVAYIITNAAKNGKNPAAALIGLTVGLIAIKSAFAAATKPATTSSRGNNLMAIPVQVSFKGDAGRVLEEISTNNTRRNGRTKA